MRPGSREAGAKASCHITHRGGQQLGLGDGAHLFSRPQMGSRSRMARVPSCHLTFAAAVLFDDDGGWVSVPWVGGRSSSLPVAVWAWQGMNLNLEVDRLF